MTQSSMRTEFNAIKAGFNKLPGQLSSSMVSKVIERQIPLLKWPEVKLIMAVISMAIQDATSTKKRDIPTRDEARRFLTERVDNFAELIGLNPGVIQTILRQAGYTWA